VTGPARAVDRVPAPRPQPAHRGRLAQPAGRKRQPRSPRPAGQNPQAPPRHAAQPRRPAI